MTERRGSAARADAKDHKTEQTDRGDAPSQRVVKSGKDARQGRIILDTPPKRWIFGAGLVGIVIVFVVAATAV